MRTYYTMTIFKASGGERHLCVSFASLQCLLSTPASQCLGAEEALGLSLLNEFYWIKPISLPVLKCYYFLRRKITKQLKESAKLSWYNLDPSDSNVKLPSILVSEKLSILYFTPSGSVLLLPNWVEKWMDVKKTRPKNLDLV